MVLRTALLALFPLVAGSATADRCPASGSASSQDEPVLLQIRPDVQEKVSMVSGGLPITLSRGRDKKCQEHTSWLQVEVYPDTHCESNLTSKTFSEEGKCDGTCGTPGTDGADQFECVGFTLRRSHFRDSSCATTTIGAVEDSDEPVCVQSGSSSVKYSCVTASMAVVHKMYTNPGCVGESLVATRAYPVGECYTEGDSTSVKWAILPSGSVLKTMYEGSLNCTKAPFVHSSNASACTADISYVFQTWSLAVAEKATATNTTTTAATTATPTTTTTVVPTTAPITTTTPTTTTAATTTATTTPMATTATPTTTTTAMKPRATAMTTTTTTIHHAHEEQPKPTTTTITTTAITAVRTAATTTYTTTTATVTAGPHLLCKNPGTYKADAVARSWCDMATLGAHITKVDCKAAGCKHVYAECFCDNSKPGCAKLGGHWKQSKTCDEEIKSYPGLIDDLAAASLAGSCVNITSEWDKDLSVTTSIFAESCCGGTASVCFQAPAMTTASPTTTSNASITTSTASSTATTATTTATAKTTASHTTTASASNTTATTTSTGTTATTTAATTTATARTTASHTTTASASNTTATTTSTGTTATTTAATTTATTKTTASHTTTASASNTTATTTSTGTTATTTAATTTGPHLLCKTPDAYQGGAIARSWCNMEKLPAKVTKDACEAAGCSDVGSTCTCDNSKRGCAELGGIWESFVTCDQEIDDAAGLINDLAAAVAAGTCDGIATRWGEPLASIAGVLAEPCCGNVSASLCHKVTTTTTTTTSALTPGPHLLCKTPDAYQGDAPTRAWCNMTNVTEIISKGSCEAAGCRDVDSTCVCDRSKPGCAKLGGRWQLGMTCDEDINAFPGLVADLFTAAKAGTCDNITTHWGAPLVITAGTFANSCCGGVHASKCHEAPQTPAPTIPTPITNATRTPAPQTPAPTTPTLITNATWTPAPQTPSPTTPTLITNATWTPGPHLVCKQPDEYCGDKVISHFCDLANTSSMLKDDEVTEQSCQQLGGSWRNITCDQEIKSCGLADSLELAMKAGSCDGVEGLWGENLSTTSEYFAKTCCAGVGLCQVEPPSQAPAAAPLQSPASYCKDYNDFMGDQLLTTVCKTRDVHMEGCREAGCQTYDGHCFCNDIEACAEAGGDWHEMTCQEHLDSLTNDTRGLFQQAQEQGGCLKLSEDLESAYHFEMQRCCASWPATVCFPTYGPVTPCANATSFTPDKPLLHICTYPTDTKEPSLAECEEAGFSNCKEEPACRFFGGTYQYSACRDALTADLAGYLHAASKTGSCSAWLSDAVENFAQSCCADQRSLCQVSLH